MNLTDPWTLAAWAALIAGLAGFCLVGWSVGDLVFGPDRVAGRAKAMALAGIPLGIVGIVCFALAVRQSIEG